MPNFNLQIVGLLILFYFGGKLFFRNHPKVLRTLDAITYSSLILFLVINTGAVHSSLFFLLYFLLFGLSLLFGPNQAILVSLFLIVFFLIDPSSNLDQPAIINLITLFFITPLASIFGKKYLQNLEEYGKIKILDKIISEEETDTLIWLSTEAKPTLINLLDTTSQIIASNLLPRNLQDKLKNLHHDLISLHESANTLEKDIDKHSNE